MDEKELKTSGKQRFFIILIAILMLGSIIASYAAIIINGSSSTSNTPNIDEVKVAELTAAYEEAMAGLPEASKSSFDKLVKYKSEVKAFNEAAANEKTTVEVKDLEVGSGRTLTEEDNNYLAFYIGFCPNETVFESSFDDYDNPTQFEGFFDVYSNNPIEGWTMGMNGAKLGGVRKITIPAGLAYKDEEICDGTNKPISFIIAPVAREGKLKEIIEAAQRLEYAQYGIDFDAVKQNTE